MFYVHYYYEFEGRSVVVDLGTFPVSHHLALDLAVCQMSSASSWPSQYTNARRAVTRSNENTIKTVIAQYNKVS